MLFKDVKKLLAGCAALPAERVVHPDTFAAGINPAAPLQVSQVTRHGGLGEVQRYYQVADAQLTFGLQQEDDAQADRVGEGFKGLGEMFHSVRVIERFIGSVK